MKLDGETALHLLLAVFLPPVAVFLKKGAGTPLLINIVLTLLMVLPGSIPAVLVVLGKIK